MNVIPGEFGHGCTSLISACPDVRTSGGRPPSTKCGRRAWARRAFRSGPWRAGHRPCVARPSWLREPRRPALQRPRRSTLQRLPRPASRNSTPCPVKGFRTGAAWINGSVFATTCVLGRGGNGRRRYLGDDLRHSANNRAFRRDNRHRRHGAQPRIVGDLHHVILRRLFAVGRGMFDPGKLHVQLRHRGGQRLRGDFFRHALGAGGADHRQHPNTARNAADKCTPHRPCCFVRDRFVVTHRRSPRMQIYSGFSRAQS